MKPLALTLLPFAVVYALQPEQQPASVPAPAPSAVEHDARGWVDLGGADFMNVNCAPDTWQWKPDGSVYCTGQPVGVTRTREPLTNFEFLCYWRHLKPAGNSGVFVWATQESLDALKPDAKQRLPHGVEVQVLDHGYTEQYERSSGKKATWFTTHGDVFPVGKTKLKPFPPLSPDGSRSFPRKHLSKGAGEWNFYYVRAINGEVRLWVNGEEVSGGSNANPATGYLCLESEGSPIEFRDLRLRKLP